MHRGPVGTWILALVVGMAGAGTGRIVGTLTPAGQATRVGAIERIPPTIKKLMDKTHWGRLEKDTGAYVIEGLAPGRYDLAIETPQGRIEGVVLAVRGEADQPTYDLVVATGELRTQRVDLSQYLEEGQVLPEEERRKLLYRTLRIAKLLDRLEKLKKVSRFMDEVRPLHIHGTRQRAEVLVELARTRAFYAGTEGEAIWRVETWPFIWMRDVWHKPRKGLRVWQRLRLKADGWARLGYVYDPRLGGLEVQAGEDTRLDYRVPDSLPTAWGKVPQ